MKQFLPRDCISARYGLESSNEDGSNVRRITDNVARDISPRFSPDGKWIAFSPDRYGNYDVFLAKFPRHSLTVLFRFSETLQFHCQLPHAGN